MSERLLFNTNSAIFQIYHGENKLIFNEMTRSNLHYRPTRWVGFVVLVHWNKSPQVDISPLWHIILIPSLCSFSLMLPAWRETTNTNYTVWFDPTPRSTALEESVLTIMPPMRLEHRLKTCLNLESFKPDTFVFILKIF